MKIYFLSLILFFSNCLNIDLVRAENTAESVKQDKSNNVGKFVLQYQNTTQNQDVRELLVSSKVFDEVIDNLNNSGLIIRQNIPVVFKDCGEPNGYWNPKKQDITLCYEMIAFGFNLFLKNGGYSEEKAVQKSIRNNLFVFYHELGHALIDLLSLSAVGQEEDTVDEFATFMLFRAYDANLAANTVLDSSEFYEILFKSGLRGSGWGEHAPNDKRLFNLVCFVYGSNPEKYEEIFVKKFNLLNRDGQATQQDLEGRAYKCVQDFSHKKASWNKLLIPHYASQNRNPNQPNNQKPAGNSPGVSRRGTYW
jgi:hypothetical protein